MQISENRNNNERRKKQQRLDLYEEHFRIGQRKLKQGPSSSKTQNAYGG